MSLVTERQLQNMIEKIPSARRESVIEYDMENMAKGRALNTRACTLKALVSFTNYINKPFDEVTKNDVVNWANSLRDMAPSTQGLYKMRIKAFYKWLNGGEEYPDVVKWIKPNRKRKNTIEILTLDDVKKMVESTRNQRDRALIMTLYESGCRASEIMDMRIRDIKMDRYGAVCLVNGKTGGRRIRLVDAVPDLQLWLGMHPQKDDPDAPLWISSSGEGIRHTQLHTIVSHLGKKAGIKKKAHPHLLRHSRLTEMAKHLTDAELKVFAGWEADSRMPGIYIHLSGADIDKKILGIHGLVEEEEKVEDRPLTPKKCPRCETNNPPTAKFCYRCSAVLDIKTAQEMEEASKAPDEWMEHITGDKEALFAEFMEFMEFKKAQKQKNSA